MTESYCIDKKLLGTQKNFVCRLGSYFWSSTIPDYTWWLNGQEKQHSNLCLDTVLKLNAYVLNTKPPAQFINAMSQFNLSGSSTPWQDVLPSNVFKTFSRDLIKNVELALNNVSKDYYKTIWVAGNEVLNSLVTAKANKEAYDRLMNDPENLNKPAVDTFKPQQWGNLLPVTYNRFGTRTGRLTISSGPMVLTVKKEYRRELIKSRYENGKIVEVDFANLEPRVILEEAGRFCEELDLYDKLNNELFNGQAKRDAIKGAVISLLYGMHETTLQIKLGIPLEQIRHFIKIIHEYFKSKELLKRIKAEFIEKNHITNKFGRRVEIDVPLDRIFTNSYAQSSGVDVAMLGFREIIKRFEDRKIKPIFLVVDAILFDVDENEMPFVKTLKHVNVNGTNYPVKITVY